MKKLATLFLLALFFSTPANAQFHVQRIDTLLRVFVSEPGTRPAFLDNVSSFFTDFDHRFDATGDGEPELVLTNEDTEGNLLDLIVLDIKKSGVDTTIKILDVPQTLGLAEPDGMEFFGFADVDGDETNEVVFANGRDVWLVNPNDHSTEWAYSVQIPSEFPVHLHGITDFTDDRFPDLVLFLPQQKQVEVWSKSP